MSLVVGPWALAPQSSYSERRARNLLTALLRLDTALLQLIESVIVAIEPMFVHLHNSQQPGCAFCNFRDQLCRPIKLAIMFSGF
jgi:hypothetical protein